MPPRTGRTWALSLPCNRLNIRRQGPVRFLGQYGAAGHAAKAFAGKIVTFEQLGEADRERDPEQKRQRGKSKGYGGIYLIDVLGYKIDFEISENLFSYHRERRNGTSERLSDITLRGSPLPGCCRSTGLGGAPLRREALWQA